LLHSRLPERIKSALISFALFFFARGLLHAQELILITYQRSFLRAGLPSKASVLLDAVNDDRADEFIGELYNFALRYVYENGEVLGDDPDMKNLALTAARGAVKAGHPASADMLWNVFTVLSDSFTRVEILNSLTTLALSTQGGNNSLIKENLNRFLLDASNDSHAGLIVDNQLIKSVIKALVSFGDSSSYQALLSAAGAFPPPLSKESGQAMDAIPGNLKEFLLGRIRGGQAQEKLAAFMVVEESRSLSISDKGELGEAALESALLLPSQDEFSILLRCAAIRSLTLSKRTRASRLVIRHFHTIHTEYMFGIVPKERFIEAIVCLKSMGDFESAQTLILELGYINSSVEKNSAYDGEIVLALIKNLGEMGNKAAFDNLLYISYLGYPEEIKNAARDALNLLKW
jgi:hypothetical protein